MTSRTPVRTLLRRVSLLLAAASMLRCAQLVEQLAALLGVAPERPDTGGSVLSVDPERPRQLSRVGS